MIEPNQPAGSACCGQACLAALANISIEDACRLVGKRGPTTIGDMLTALRALGLECGHLRCAPDCDVEVAIGRCEFRFTREGPAWHWVLIEPDGVYNPLEGEQPRHPCPCSDCIPVFGTVVGHICIDDADNVVD